MATIEIPDLLYDRLQQLAQDRDITPQQLLSDLVSNPNDKNLAWQYAQFETAMNAVSDGLIIHGKDGVVIDINERALQIFGVQRDQVVGVDPAQADYETWERFTEDGIPIPHEDRPVPKAFREKQAIDNYVMQIKRTDNINIWITVRTQPIWDDSSDEVYAVVTAVSDITTIKEKEKQLERQAKLLNIVSDAIITTNAYYVVMDWNKGAERVYGWTAEEAIGKSMQELTDNQYLDQTEEQAFRYFLQNGYWSGEVLQTTKAGERRYIDASVSAIRDDAGRIIGGVAVNRDVTAQRLVEKELRRERDVLERFMTVTPVCITMTDKHGQIMFANQSAERVLGISKDEITQHTYNASVWGITDYEGYPIPDEDLPFSQVMRSGTAIYGYQHAISRENGQRILLSINAVPSINDNGELDGIVASIEDVTERVHALDALKESEQRFRQLIENLTVGVLLQDASSRILMANPTACRLLGIYEEQIMGVASDDPIWRIIREDGSRFPNEEHPVPVAIHTKQPVRSVIMGVHRAKTNDYVWLLVNADPQLDENGHVKDVICTFTDFTEQYQLEKSLREAIETEKSLNKLQARFISIVSHEYRTPLATIMSATEMMKRYQANISPERRVEYLDRIQEQVHQLNSFVDDVLTLSRAEELGFKFAPEYIDLDGLCRLIIEEMRLADNERHDIVFVPDAIYTQAFLDQYLIRYVLNNLLTNAVKYSPPNTQIDFHLDCHDDENALTFTISDHGIGIPEEDRDRIFQRFHRGTNVGNIAGTGLGLAIVWRAVEAHGGTISVESRFGEGTTFTVRIPTSFQSI